ncbi:MAG: phage tail protein [Pseudonocardiaceae bacterium]
MLRLQRAAGNAAVARMLTGARSTARSSSSVQRLVSGPAVCPTPPRAPGPVTPEKDPGFAAVKGKIGAAAQAATKHPPASTEAKAAQNAAIAPPDDKDAQAKTALAGEMGAAKPAPFDKAAFIAAVNKAIAAQAPKNLDEADKFASSGKADNVKAEVMGKVTKGKEDSAKPLAEKSQQAPDTSKAVDKPVTPLPATKPETTPAPLDAAKAMPPKAPAEQTNLGGPKCETDKQMAEAGVTEGQLAKSNEPQFTEAVAAKKDSEAHSATAPAQVRQSEAQQLNAAQAGAQQAGQAGAAVMAKARTRALQQVAGQQGATKSTDEAKRAQVSGPINAIFDKTKTEVTNILGALDGLVSTKFEEGERAAKAAFTADHQARMQRYKDQRYSGPAGWLRWTGDLFADLPAEANQLFVESRKLYESKMQAVISDIADLVGRELARAKERVAAGRAEIAKYVAGLSPELQKVGAEAAKEIGGKFDELDASVDEKSESLVEDLASKYVEARNAVDEEIKTLQEQNKGLWSKAKDAVGGAIETIMKLKDMLLGVLARAAGAIEKIIMDPIGFLGKFVNAIKTGITNFASNIVDHLKKGLQGWLLGSLANAGIEMPEKFDLKGIVKLVLSLLGLTWSGIRARLTKFIPEPVLVKIEQTVEIFKILVTEGVGGLWKWIVGKLTDLKDMVMGQIRDFVITKIVKAGITWLISLLNPAAAFIKACKMIYDVVMFFVEKADQIKEFVDSVLDSIESIAKGGVGAVAGYIEKTLAKTLPVVLGFLASLLGLGGISEKIKEVLKAAQEKVGQAVDWVIKGALKLARPLIKAFKAGAGWVKGKIAAGKAWVKGKYEAGKAWVKKKYEAGKAWVKGKVTAVKDFFSVRKSFTVNGENHSLCTTGASTQLKVASARPTNLRNHPDRAVRDAYAVYQKVMNAAKTPAAKERASHAPLKVIIEMLTQWFKKSGSNDPQASAPGIGNIAPYRNQPSSLRKPGDPPVWAMTAEHVIPRAFSDAAFTALKLEDIPAGGTDYEAQHTIMIYKGAADLKTNPPGADNAMTSDLKSKHAEILDHYHKAKPSARPALVRVVFDAVAGLLAGYADDAVDRTVKAVNEENKINRTRRGLPGSPERSTPPRDRIQKAAWQQIQDIVRQLRSRLR